MSYTVTRSTPDTPWLINALFATHNKHLPRWRCGTPAVHGPVPESAYGEWWYADYGSVLTYEIDQALLIVKWTVAFADEKEYLMFLLRWT